MNLLKKKNSVTVTVRHIAREITGENKVGFSSLSDKSLSYNEIQSGAMAELKKIMSPELLNRIDDVVVFNTLSRQEVSAILDIQMSELQERLASKGFSVKLNEKAREYMIDNGYDPAMGARPMRRLIQKELEDKLSVLILEGTGKKGSSIIVGRGTQGLSLRFQQPRKKVEVMDSGLIGNSENAN